MKRLNSLYKLSSLFILCALSLAIFHSCQQDDPYAKSRKRERKQIETFLQKGASLKDADTGLPLLTINAPIHVISEQQFYKNDTTTDVAKNEYVLFAASGIYMQIIRKGSGKRLKSGETSNVICRYVELNLASDTIQSANSFSTYESLPDIMTVKNEHGTLTATFTSGLMRTLYSPSVPGGWLFPLHFINLGRQQSPNSEIAMVRLILPSTEGQVRAQQGNYPCFYQITYERGR